MAQQLMHTAAKEVRFTAVNIFGWHDLTVHAWGGCMQRGGGQPQRSWEPAKMRLLKSSRAQPMRVVCSAKTLLLRKASAPCMPGRV